MVLRGIECVADDESQEPDPSNEYDITEMNQQEIAEESQDEEELAYQEEDNETSSEMLCGSQLSDEATLTNVEQENLMQTHHQMIQKVSVKSSRKYQCTICLKLFESPSKVQRHLSVHRDVLDPSDIPKRPQKEFKVSLVLGSRRNFYQSSSSNSTNAKSAAKEWKRRLSWSDTW